MSRRPSPNIILYSFVSLVISILLVALVSLYFSDKTVDIKQQELQLAQQLKTLEINIARKKELYRSIEDNIDDMQESIGLKSNSSHEDIDKVLRKSSPMIKKMVLASLPCGYPCKSRRITSHFGYRMHPILHKRRFHHGIDFGGHIGIPIKATADGIVEFSGFNKGGYGNLVMISHNFGFKTVYGHMLKNLQVKKGDFVKKGMVIGYLGNTGMSTGPHLHYEIKYLKNIIDPQYFLTADTKHFRQLLKNEKHILWQPLIHAITDTYRRYTGL